MVKPMDLRTFFSNSPIQLSMHNNWFFIIISSCNIWLVLTSVAYEIPHAVISKYPNAHPYKTLSYVFSMRLTPVDPETTPIVELPTVISSEDEDEDNCESERLDSDTAVLEERIVKSKEEESSGSENEKVK